MMTADEARAELQRKMYTLKVEQLSAILDGINKAIGRLEDYATFDFSVFSEDAHQELINAGYKIRTSETATNTIVQISW